MQILNIFSTIFLLTIIFSTYILSFFSLSLFFVFSFFLFPMCYLFSPFCVTPLFGDISPFYIWNWVSLLPILLFFWFFEPHIYRFLLALFFSLLDYNNKRILCFFGGFTFKTWFLSSINGGRPLLLFGLTCTSW